MTRPGCMNQEQLLAYWLGELNALDEARLDEHLFTCAACTARLEALVALGAAIRREALRGYFGFVVPGSFVGRMKDAGLTIREYPVGPGGSVNCTIAPGDDFVVSILRAPLEGVQQLDLLMEQVTIGTQRLRDVPFDPKTDRVMVVPSATFLRSLGHSEHRMTLVAVDGAVDRVIGEYTFNHSPS